MGNFCLYTGLKLWGRDCLKLKQNKGEDGTFRNINTYMIDEKEESNIIKGKTRKSGSTEAKKENFLKARVVSGWWQST